MSELLTPSEVADSLRLTHRQLMALVREGKLPCVRLSRKVVRFDREALQRHLAGTDTTPALATG
jgi:excisionase family DNA binding protein